MGILIQKRDIEILKALFACGYLSTSQIQRLFFGKNHSVVCRRLNQCLLPQQIIIRHRPDIAFDSIEAIYSIGPAGIPILAKALNIDCSKIDRPKRRVINPFFLNHTIETNDFWIAMRMACNQSEHMDLVSWWTEKKLRKRYQRIGDIETPLPDSRFVLKHHEMERLYFLEIDRGTERSPVFQQKISRYLNYYLSGRHLDDYGHNVFRVLTVVPDEKRLKTLLKVSAEAGANNIFLFTVKKNTSPEQIGTPIWTTPRDYYDIFKDLAGTIHLKEINRGHPPKYYSIF